MIASQQKEICSRVAIQNITNSVLEEDTVMPRTEYRKGELTLSLEKHSHWKDKGNQQPPGGVGREKETGPKNKHRRRRSNQIKKKGEAPGPRGGKRTDKQQHERDRKFEDLGSRDRNRKNIKIELWLLTP